MTPYSFCGIIAIFIVMSGAQLIYGASVPGLILPLQEVKVGTPVEGLVKNVLVEEGETVESGQPLVQLVDDLEVMDVARAEKILEKAKFDHDAAQKLLKENIGSREEALRKSIEYDLARIQLESAKVRVAQKKLLSPMQGIVVSRLKEPGEAVQLHEVLLHVVHVSQLEAQFYLDTENVQKLQIGGKYKLIVAGSHLSTVIGEVVYIDPRLDAESGLCRVKLRVDNKDLKLKAGMRAELQMAAD